MEQTDDIEYVIRNSSWKKIFHKLKKQTAASVEALWKSVQEIEV